MTYTRLNPSKNTVTLTDGGASRSGDVVSVRVKTSVDSSWTWKNLGTLPSDMRPAQAERGTTATSNGSGDVGLMMVETSGVVSVFQHNGSTSEYTGTLTFIV